MSAAAASAEDAFEQVMRSGQTRAFDLLRAMRAFLGENDMMAYLAMMAIRLIELHRVLKGVQMTRDLHSAMEREKSRSACSSSPRRRPARCSARRPRWAA